MAPLLAEGLPALRSLDLGSNCLGEGTLAALAHAPCASHLTRLDLSESLFLKNDWRPEGALRALAALRDLDLSGICVGEGAAAGLAARPLAVALAALPTLAFLNLERVSLRARQPARRGAPDTVRLSAPKRKRCASARELWGWSELARRLPGPAVLAVRPVLRVRVADLEEERRQERRSTSG